MIDRHLLAAVSLAGVVLDFMGGLYLAYDLLGGKRGPLRVLTRPATYPGCALQSLQYSTTLLDVQIR